MNHTIPSTIPAVPALIEDEAMLAAGEIENIVPEADVRPGASVMEDDLANDAMLAAAAAAGTPTTESTGTPVLSGAPAVAAWERIAAARATPGCRFIGIDLHSNNAVVNVCLNAADLKHGGVYGKVIYRKRIATTDGGIKLKAELAKFCEGQAHVACVESTYNIYFLADMFETAGWNLVIADPCAVSQARLKNTDDFTDAEFLADKMRASGLHICLILPHADRAVRDLVRFRGHLVQERARCKTTFINMVANQLSVQLDTSIDELARLAYEDSPDLLFKPLAGIFKDPLVRMKAGMILREIHFRTLEIDRLSKELHAYAKKALRYAPLLQRIRGCGPVIASVIAAETWDISRFATAKDFVSYCRLAPTARLSNGKSKGTGNAKNGNAYMSWAMTELANLMVRFDACAAAAFEAQMKRCNGLRVKAIRTLAGKIARALFYVMRDGLVFDSTKLFGNLKAAKKKATRQCKMPEPSANNTTTAAAA